MSIPDFEDVRTGQRSFSSVGAFSDGHVSVLTGGARPRSVCRIYVTPGLFETLGAAAAARAPARPGRLRAGRAGCARDRWTVALALRIGPRQRARLRLDEQPFTIVGIIPADVFGLLQPRERLLDEGRFDRCVVTPLVRAATARAR